jgi:hypothetical protein
MKEILPSKEKEVRKGVLIPPVQNLDKKVFEA